jgi:NAD(P)-dependent dehydrogenase (short-subunit alcohol dehydrogenase family)
MGTRSDEQTVLITGATDGLGRATAIHLAEHGYRVFAGGRSVAKRDALQALARERQLPLDVLDMDVCDDASVDRAVGEVERRAGPVDVLINNAGFAVVAVMEEITLADLRRQFETNFFAVVRVTQRVLPAMRQRRAGRIINMSSIAGKVAWPLFGPYSASKFALEGMSDALRLELRPFGIHVAVIEPGYIPTNMGRASQEVSSEYASRARQSPYARVYQGFFEQWKKTTAQPKYTPVDCARVILRAMRETPPKPRYTVTRRARVLSVAKRLLPDTVFDRRTLRAMGLDRR